MNAGSRVNNVVLVHGGFVHGSGWQSVYNLLREHGYNVSIVQNPTLSLEGDAEATRQIIDAPGWAGRPGRPLLRRRGDHRSGQPRQRGGKRLHRCVRAGR